MEPETEIERRKVESLNDTRYVAQQRGTYALLPNVHDYPPFLPEIPMAYWTFVYSFKIYISRRLPTDLA